MRINLLACNWLNMWINALCEGIKVSAVHPEGTMNIWTGFHETPSKIFYLKKKKKPHGEERGKVRESTKKIHSIVVKIFTCEAVDQYQHFDPKEPLTQQKHGCKGNFLLPLTCRDSASVFPGLAIAASIEVVVVPILDPSVRG